MAAQSYDESPPRRAEQQQPRAAHAEQPPPRGGHPGQPGQQQPPRSRSRQDTRTLGNQETIISDAPRRSRRRGSGEPPEPPGPPTKKGGGRGGWRRFVPSWKIVVAGTVVLAAGLFGMIMVAYANTPVPTSAQSEATAQQSTIYFRDGKTPIATLGFKREIVPFAKMDEDVRNAAVAIENKTFWEDSGISLSGMARSVWMTATGQQLQGASTITQQMARGYYDGLSQEVSIQRKVKEIFVAVKLDETMSKEKILETYLNTINFGRAYGVEAAAKAYFPGPRVTAAKLTPSRPPTSPPASSSRTGTTTPPRSRRASSRSSRTWPSCGPTSTATSRRPPSSPRRAPPRATTTWAGSTATWSSRCWPSWRTAD
ncbi:transglycosylase domain-containing protein [Nonomuraea rubra]|uniref:transglycosylase domain-containing protein n=1 Tax=Nonomuraea rubra TaxID=46180 RepID=UPI00360725B8